MNAAIVKLFGLTMLLFAVLAGFTSWWTVFGASSLRDNVANRRPLLEAATIDRGPIRAGDGTLLATDVPNGGGTWRRTYPLASLFGHAIGYDFITLGSSALERYRDATLTGRTAGGVNSLLSQLSGRKPRGDEVDTTLDPRAQRAAYAGLAGRRGAVIALDPSTGAIKVMASVPTFDPNQVAQARQYHALVTDPSAPLLDRVTQSGYPPGSTFKVVTAVAAIDSGLFTPSSTLNGDSPKIISGRPLSNDGNVSWGNIDLTTALTHSVNTVFAQLALRVGGATMARYMERFGFYAKPAIDEPRDELFASGEYGHGHLLTPTSDLIDVGRMGIGQDKLLVTPLQMAEVAAAVANGGVLMAPQLTARIVDPDGRVVQTIAPRALGRVMKPSTAAAVTAMMANVVKEGTGTAAQLQGIDVAGKTGTAQLSGSLNQVWFIAFAPIVHPRYAIAVTIERSPGQGGTVAAPIARQVLQALLAGQ